MIVILTLLVAVSTVLLFLALVLAYYLETRSVYTDLRHKHVVVTGGSSGIGLAYALEAAKKGAHVTVIGRNVQKLKDAVSLITKESRARKDQKIQYVALDLISGYETIAQGFAKLENDIGPTFMLVACAGMCVCGEFEKMKPEEINHMITLNYLGLAYPTRYVLPGMLKRNEGSIVFVSSEAAFVGIFGMSAYSAAKWAVRGLAESLFMELTGTDVSLTLAFPPDTDTPGFKTEEETKPKETKLISGSGGLLDPNVVGKKMLNDAMRRKPYSVYGITGHIMSILYCATLESVGQVLEQILLMGFLRAIMVGVLVYFNKIVQDGSKERKQTNEQTESTKDK